MTEKNGIVLDLFPPTTWDEESIRIALEIQEAADEPEGWGFSEDELTFLAKCVAYYMRKPASEWGEAFEIDDTIDTSGEDPTEDGRFVICMDYPEHLEPPASLR